MSSLISAKGALAGLWQHAGGDASALAMVELTGSEPVLPSTFAVATAAQAAIAASALAAAELMRLRTGVRQRVSVDMRHAAIEYLSERHLRIDEKPPAEYHGKIHGIYQCGDGRWIRLHANFPHHREGALTLLGCAEERAAVATAFTRWKAEEFESAAAGAGLVATMCRSFAEWDAHPHGSAVASQPVFSIERIGDAPPQQLASADRPLSGIRVLDLTRVIAGPVCGRTLAAHGADVLLVTAAHLPQMGPLVIDCGRGKLSTFVDLDEPQGRQTLARLLEQADVMVQGYRPGAIAGRGFSPEQAAHIRPGIIYVSLSAYGPGGPWAARRGFDSLVQHANGIDHAEAEAAGSSKPRPLPCQALDHSAGYFMAFGAMTALARRAREGGSWHVRVSLAQAGHWIRGLGRVEGGLACPPPAFENVRDCLAEYDSGFGRLTAVRHAARLSETPARWDRPAVPLGTHPPAWP